MFSALLLWKGVTLDPADGTAATGSSPRMVILHSSVTIGQDLGGAERVGVPIAVERHGMGGDVELQRSRRSVAAPVSALVARVRNGTAARGMGFNRPSTRDRQRGPLASRNVAVGRRAIRTPCAVSQPIQADKAWTTQGALQLAEILPERLSDLRTAILERFSTR